MISLEHPKVEELLGIRDISNPDTSLTPLLYSRLFGVSSRPDAVRSLPDSLQIHLPPFEAHALHSHSPLILCSADSQILVRDRQLPREMAQTVLGFAIRFLQSKVDERWPLV
jgi:hypothetical protein